VCVCERTRFLCGYLRSDCLIKKWKWYAYLNWQIWLRPIQKVSVGNPHGRGLMFLILLFCCLNALLWLLLNECKMWWLVGYVSAFCKMAKLAYLVVLAIANTISTPHFYRIWTWTFWDIDMNDTWNCVNF